VLPGVAPLAAEAMIVPRRAMGNGNTNAYADKFRNPGTRMSKGITAITIFKATQEIKGDPATSITYQTLFSPAILIDDVQVNFSTIFRVSYC
jgi:hypothetical protein